MTYDDFTTYPIDRLYKQKTRIKAGKVTWLLGLEDVCDEQLFEAIKNSGITLTRPGQIPVPSPDVLDIVLRERASWQRRQKQQGAS